MAGGLAYPRCPPFPNAVPFSCVRFVFCLPFSYLLCSPPSPGGNPLDGKAGEKVLLEDGAGQDVMFMVRGRASITRRGEEVSDVCMVFLSSRLLLETVRVLVPFQAYCSAIYEAGTFFWCVTLLELATFMGLVPLLGWYLLGMVPFGGWYPWSPS